MGDEESFLRPWARTLPAACGPAAMTAITGRVCCHKGRHVLTPVPVNVSAHRRIGWEEMVQREILWARELWWAEVVAFHPVSLG